MAGQDLEQRPPLLVSKREAARLLRVSRARTLEPLIRAGIVAVVPWGTSVRVPLAEVQRLAREGFTAPGRRRPAPRRARPGVCDPEALRHLDLEDL